MRQQRDVTENGIGSRRPPVDVQLRNMLLHLLILVVLPHLSFGGPVGSIGLKAGTLKCGLNEEKRICGPKCPPTCDTLKDDVCCEVSCVEGCFCKDGFMLQSKNGPQKCIPFEQCPSSGVLQFEVITVIFLEGEKVARIKVVRVNGSFGEVSVRWRIVDGTFPEPRRLGILAALKGIVIFPDGIVSQIIEIPIDDNDIRNPDIVFQLELFEPSRKTKIVTRNGFNRVSVTIKDDDMKPGYLEVESTRLVVLENVGIAEVNVVRLGGTDGQVRVRYKTVSVSANDRSDFSPTTGELIFEEGENLKSIRIKIIDDNLREKSEFFRIQLSDSKAGPDILNFRGLTSKNSTLIVIEDDDMRPGYLELEKDSITVKEDVGSLQVKVVRLHGTDGQIKIRFRVTGKTARAGFDFTASEGELVFEEGESSKTILIPIFDNGIREPEKTLQVELYDPSTAPDVINFRARGSILSTEVTITDDDMKPGYLELEKPSYVVPENVGFLHVSVVRLGGSDGEISVKYRTVPKSAEVKLDFESTSGELVFEEGETRKFILIPITNDFVKEPVKKFEIQLYDSTAGLGVINFKGLGTTSTSIVTISDDDMKPGYPQLEKSAYVVSENIGVLKVGVIRVGGSDGEIRVKYTVTEKTATAKSDFEVTAGELIFKEGETQKFITIKITNDDIREHTETFEIQLIESTAAPGVVNFRGIGSISTTVVTITDDDMKPGSLEVEKSSYTVSENEGTVRIGVVRTGGSDGQIRVQYRTESKTAVVGVDFVLASGELVFDEGETKKYIVIRIIDDAIREASKVFELQLSDSTTTLDVLNFRGLGSKVTTTITINDDDMHPGFLEFERSPIIISESDELIKIGVVRIGGGDGEIGVKYKTEAKSATAKSDFEPTSGELLFKEEEIQKYISIKITNDDIREPTETFEIQLFNSSASPGVINFRGLVESKLTKVVTIIDDDMRPGHLEVQEETITVSENVSTVDIKVVRIGGSDGEIRTKYRTVEESATANDDFIPETGEIVFENGITSKVISIAIKNDKIREPTETLRVELFDSSPGIDVINFKSTGWGQTSLITILDDDGTPGTFEFRESHAYFSEDDRKIVLTVVRTGGTDGSVTLRWRTIDGTAKEGVDYFAKLGSVTFNEGESEKTFVIDIINDRIKENDEQFVVGLFNPTNGGVLGPNSLITVVIKDNDDKPSIVSPVVPETPEIFFRQRIIRVNKDSDTARIFIRRTGDDKLVTFYLETLDGSAVAGEDYRRVRGEIQFGENEIRLTVDIKLLKRSNSPGLKFFQVRISKPSAGRVEIGKDVLTVIIGDGEWRSDTDADFTASKTDRNTGFGTSGSNKNFEVGPGVNREHALSGTVSGVNRRNLGHEVESSLKGGFSTDGFNDNRKIEVSGGGSIGNRDVSVFESAGFGTDGEFVASGTRPGASGGFQVSGSGSASSKNFQISAGASRGSVQNEERLEARQKKCPSGMTFRKCAPSCPKTCANFHEHECGEKCIDACFCPDGQVIENLISQKCVQPSACPSSPSPRKAISGGLLGGLLTGVIPG